MSPNQKDLAALIDRVNELQSFLEEATLQLRSCLTDAQNWRAHRSVLPLYPPTPLPIQVPSLRAASPVDDDSEEDRRAALIRGRLFIPADIPDSPRRSRSNSPPTPDSMVFAAFLRERAPPPSPITDEALLLQLLSREMQTPFAPPPPPMQYLATEAFTRLHSWLVQTEAAVQPPPPTRSPPVRSWMPPPARPANEDDASISRSADPSA